MEENDPPKVLNSLWECGTSLHNISIINNAALVSLVMYTIFSLFPAIVFAKGEVSEGSIT